MKRSELDPRVPIKKFDMELMRFRLWKRRRWGWRRYFQDPDKRLDHVVSFRLDSTEQALLKKVCEHYRQRQHLLKSDVLRMLILQEASKLGFWSGGSAVKDE